MEPNVDDEQAQGGTEGDEEGTQFLIALCSTNRELGIACYDELTNIIYADCINISSDDLADTLNNIKTAFKPTLFLVHPRMVSNKSLMDSLLSGPDGSPDFYRFKVLKSSNWNEKSTLQLIFKQLVVKENMISRSIPGNNYQRLASKVELENELVRQSLGALLSFMQSTIFHLDDGRVIVSSIKPFPLESYMRIDSNSLKGLQIFAEEVHPNVIKSQGRNKEGFSLFGLFDRTHSTPGRQKLREWMSKPYYDKQRILDRQLGISIVINAANHDMIKSIIAILRHIHDVPRLVLRIKKVQSTYSDWCKLYSSLVYGVQIIDILLQFLRTNSSQSSHGVANTPMATATASEIDYITALIGLLNMHNVRDVLHALSISIDFDASEASGALTMRSGYDRTLDELRSLYDNLEEHLVKAAHRVLDIVPLLQNVSVEYVPQIGYLVAVQENNVHFLQNSEHGVNRRHHNSSGGGVRGVKRPATLDLTRPHSTASQMGGGGGGGDYSSHNRKRMNVIPTNPSHNQIFGNMQPSQPFGSGGNAHGGDDDDIFAFDLSRPDTAVADGFFSHPSSQQQQQRGFFPSQGTGQGELFGAPVLNAPSFTQDIFSNSINALDTDTGSVFGGFNQHQQHQHQRQQQQRNPFSQQSMQQDDDWTMPPPHTASAMRPGSSAAFGQGSQRPSSSAPHYFQQQQLHVVEENDSDGGGGDAGSSFQFVYSQDGVHYFKHNIVYALDDSIGDVKSDILDRQRVLLLQLEEAILDYEPDLQHLSLTLATLDAIISLGTIAKEQRMVKPEIVGSDPNNDHSSHRHSSNSQHQQSQSQSHQQSAEDHVVIIKNGRHLLQELTVDSFIPNDTYIVGNKNIALITGPNSSGKSVYIKQVGLIVYLAHIGSYVPADRAIISLTDAIFTRINNTESVSNPLSSFAIDITQMTKMLTLHTPRSLCIIDEFGKGTTPIDGIALLASTVKHFAKYRGKALFVLHFIEIIHPSVLDRQCMDAVSCFCMETHKVLGSAGGGGIGGAGGTPLLTLDGDESGPSSSSSQPTLATMTEETHVPLFKLKLGVSTSSEGLPCAKHAGIAGDIVHRAAAIKSHINSRTAIPADPKMPKGYSALLSKNDKHRELLKIFLGNRNWLAGSEHTNGSSGDAGGSSAGGIVGAMDCLKEALW